MALVRHPLILLAGGASRRMGTPKGLLRFFGRSWLEAQLQGFARAGGAQAVIVLSDFEAYEAELPWVASARERDAPVAGLRARISSLRLPTPSPFASLKVGLRAAQAAARGAFVLPIDVPVGPATWRRLEAALGPGHAALPRFGEHAGHPVLLAPAFAAQLLRCPQARPDARLDRQLESLAPEARRLVDVDDAAVRMNLNTPSDWSAWLASAEAQRCYPPAP